MSSNLLLVCSTGPKADVSDTSDEREPVLFRISMGDDAVMLSSIREWLPAELHNSLERSKFIKINMHCSYGIRSTVKKVKGERPRLSK